jgi:hypothetical protein
MKYDTPIRIPRKLSCTSSPTFDLSEKARENVMKALEPDESLPINPVTGQYINSILSGMTFKQTKFVSGELKKRVAQQQQAVNANPTANPRLMIKIARARSRPSVLIS